MKRTVKSTFIMGVIAILPIGLTVFILWFLFTKIGGFFGAVFRNFAFFHSFPRYITSIIGLISVTLIVYLIGLMTSNFIGKRILKFGEKMIGRIPLIRPIYLASRQFTDVIFVDKKAFKKAVFVEYPRKGLYTIGFITNDSKWTFKGEDKYINIIIPTTPNPTSGFYIICHESEIKEVNLSIEEAFKIIVSGGIILPENRNA